MRIEPADYQGMRAWLAYVASKVFPADLLTPATDPVAALDRLESESPAKARSGLLMAVGDLIELTSGWPDEEIASLNDELSDRDLPTFAVVRARFSRIIQRAVRRGLIKNDDEFYALRNAVEVPGIDQAAL